MILFSQIDRNQQEDLLRFKPAFLSVELEAADLVDFELGDLRFDVADRAVITERMLALLHLDELSLHDCLPADETLLTLLHLVRAGVLTARADDLVHEELGVGVVLVLTVVADSAYRRDQFALPDWHESVLVFTCIWIWLQ